MIIHIGDNISLSEDDIIIILSKNSVEDSKANLDYVNRLIQNNCLVNKVDDVKTYIITKKRNKRVGSQNIDSLRLYVSNISSSSLLKRHKELDRRETNG